MEMNRKRTKYLTKCIVETLENEELSPDFAKALLSEDGNEVTRQTESELWDYKETIAFEDPKAISKLATRVLAFHNNKGGVLIFGVKEIDSSFRLVGFPNSMIIDNSRLNDKLRKYIGSDNIIFQDRIPYPSQKTKSIWLIFIKSRKENPPKPILKNSSDNGHSFKKGQYFIRINDEVKKCTDPIHYERLFAGVSFTHLKAYTYEIDKPFYRLLLPHTEKFIGREDLKKQILKQLGSRYFILSLDGPGGIGKSALAIEIVKHLYESFKYDFIISLSAKNKVWIGYSSTKQSDFSGLYEFLRELASVLCIDVLGKSTEILQQEILSFISGSKGIILIDNIEEITDRGVFEFIQKIPDPVKIIVTSRISKDLGALRIDVPRMSENEATELLKFELRFHQYSVKPDEEPLLKIITEACGYLPLAIKWAASFINNPTCVSLIDLYNRIKQMDSNKKEFLEYIFSTMYDELSQTAKEVALLSIYLDIKDWTETSCSIILNKDEGEINECISELEDKDILIKREDDRYFNEVNMLPITIQFLKQKWHENRNLRVRVEQAIENLVPIPDSQDTIFDLSIKSRLTQIYQYTHILEKQGNYVRASKLIKLARQWIQHDEIDETLSVKLLFQEGKMIYFKERESGIAQMKWSLENQNENKALNNEWVFLSLALMNYGRQTDEKDAFKILEAHLGSLSALPNEFHSVHFERFFAKRKYDLILTGLTRIQNSQIAYKMYQQLKPHFQKTKNINELGSKLVKFFETSRKYDNCPKTESINLNNLISLYSNS